MPFRSDVHALRALASVFVLVFHVNQDVLPGGFSGVDIFYVISGFVIFRGLFADLDAASTLSFYKRRLFRIFPIIIVTTGLTLIAGFLVMTPDELARLAGSALASLFSVSNFYFADRLGYFAPAVNATPLIHFWSLAVEEQFYILTPLLLAAFSLCRSRRAIITLTLAIILLSFAANCVFVYAMFEETKAFYFPFTRFWEIGLGIGLAAIEPAWRPGPKLRGMATALSLAGLAASGWLLSADLAYPGLPALLPTVATALFIAAGTDGTALGRRIATWKPVTFLGDISYALYVCHWPIIVFWRLIAGGHETWFGETLILMLSIAVAALLRRTVEQPFIRLGRSMTVKKPALAITAGVATLSLLAIATLASGGFPGRLNAPARQMRARIEQAEARISACRRMDIPYVAQSSLFSRCEPGDGPSRYLLAGDSHAGMLADALSADLARAGIHGLVSTMPDCQMLVDTTTAKAKNRSKCADLHRDILEIVRRENIGVVILSSRWANIASPVRAPYDGSPPKGLYDTTSGGGRIAFDVALSRTVAAINAAGATVLIVAPVPELNFDVPSVMLRRAQFGIGIPETKRADVDYRQSYVLPALSHFDGKAGVAVEYPSAVLCDISTCRFEADGKPLYEDSNHLSEYGAEIVAAPVAERTRALLDRQPNQSSPPG